MENRFSLAGKTILVTGASSGIGRSIAIACAEEGAIIVLNGRNQARLQATKDALKGDGHIIIPADITDSIQRIAARKEDRERGVYRILSICCCVYAQYR